MLYKTTNNDVDDFVVVGSICVLLPEPPQIEPVRPPPPPYRPKPPRIEWGVADPDTGPACPAMRLKKFQKPDGSCWAMYVPIGTGTISGACGVSVAPFPATGC